jgi:transposase-like protein
VESDIILPVEEQFGERAVKAGEFQVLVGQLAGLSMRQRGTLSRLLADPSPDEAVIELLESKDADQRHCPHCRGSHVLAWGNAHGLHRYRCGDCRRTFNALTGTPLARLRYKARWLTHGAALRDAVSVRKAAEVCDVAVSTAFRWRHRFLRAAKTNQPSQLSGIVEADETFFRRSFKGSRRWKQPRPDATPPTRRARHRGTKSGKRGTPLDEQVPVLIVRDRNRTTGDAILSDLTAHTIGAELMPMLGPDALLCTDASRTYGRIARDAGIRHEAVSIAAGERVRDRVFHIQNVNAYDSRLKQWMRRFNGVATQYLDSYLGWRRMIERPQTTISPQAILLNAC